MKKLKSIKGIPLSYIKSILKIDENSPSGLTWLPRSNIQFNSYCANKPAGGKQTKENGYQSWVVKVTYNGTGYLLRCSRVILILKNGYLTKGKEIDHKDRNSLNNKVSNLREVSAFENQQNTNIPKNNTSGTRNVYWSKKNKKWLVKITANKKRYYFGYYNKLEDAIKVAIEARKKLHGEFGRDE